MSEKSTMNLRKFLTRTGWWTRPSMRSSASSWEHLRKPWLQVCPPQTLAYDVVMFDIAPAKNTGFSPEYVWHNQVMNTFRSLLLLLEKLQNVSSSNGRFCLILLSFVSTIVDILPSLFLTFCLMPVSNYPWNTMSVLSVLLERVLKMDPKYFNKSS